MNKYNNLLHKCGEKLKIISKFCDIASQHTEDIFPLPDTSNIKEATAAFTNFIIDAAKSSILFSSGVHEPGQVQWWTEEIYFSIKACRKFLRTYKVTRLQTDLIKYKKARTITGALIRYSKKRSWCSYVAGINKPAPPPPTIWKDMKSSLNYILNVTCHYCSTLNLRNTDQASALNGPWGIPYQPPSQLLCRSD
mgnify:CR=1 FL=1